METSVRDAGFVTTGDGCRIAWRCDGPADAPVLLLSNSLGTGMDMWAPQLAAWTQRFRVPVSYTHLTLPTNREV